MNKQEYQRRLLERETRYPNWKPLAADRPVHIHIDPAYGATYAGQVAAITAASLLGRMSKSVAVDVVPQPLLPPVSWMGTELDEVVIRTLKAADPYLRCEQRPAQDDDLRLVIGPVGNGLVVHGCGWECVLRRRIVSNPTDGRTESIRRGVRP